MDGDFCIWFSCFFLETTDSSSAIDGAITIPKPKRRTLLLKRKALTTGFFDSAKDKDDKTRGVSTNSGLVFGLPLDQCVRNDDRLNKENNQQRMSGGRNSLSSLLDSTNNQMSHKINTGSCESLPTIRNSLRLTSTNNEDSDSSYSNQSSSFSQSDISRRGSKDVDDHVQLIGGVEIPRCSLVPFLVTTCITYLEKYGLQTVGIFRVSTSKKRVRQLRENFDCGLTTTIEADSCPHDVATLLKEYFRDLPEPLLCRSLYPAFVRTQSKSHFT